MSGWAELLVLENSGANGNLTRKVLDDYSPAVLELFVVTAACTRLSFELYIVSPQTIALHGSDVLIYTLSFVPLKTTDESPAGPAERQRPAGQILGEAKEDEKVIELGMPSASVTRASRSVGSGVLGSGFEQKYRLNSCGTVLSHDLV